MLALHNFVLDLTALLVVKFFFHKQAGAGRIFLGAFLGTAADCLIFLVGKNLFRYQVLVQLFVNPLMLYGSFGWSGWSVFLMEWSAGYAVLAFLGGVMEWLYADGRGRMPFHVSEVFAILMLLAGSAGMRYWLHRKQRYEKAWICQNGKQLTVSVLVDSGNLLEDPYLHKPVSVMDRTCYENMFGIPEHIRLIPFSSLGCSEGMLEAISVEQLCIISKEEQLCIENAVLGLADHALFAGKAYQIVLNPMKLRQSMAH